MSDISKFAKDRNAAFIEYVKTGNTKRVRKFCKKYEIDVPKNHKVFEAGILKAVIGCSGIHEDIKTLAMQKCLAIGFNPFIKPFEGEENE